MKYKIRPWTYEDLSSLVACANNKQIARNMTDMFPSPYTNEAGLSFIKMVKAMNPTSVFAIEVDGKAIGGIGLHPQSDIHKKSLELGYWLAEEYWRKGIVSDAVKEMLNFGFETFDCNRIFARPFGKNKASQRVLEKAGFVLEARLKDSIYKNSEYDDELIYVMRRPD